MPIGRTLQQGSDIFKRVTRLAHWQNAIWYDLQTLVLALPIRLRVDPKRT